jgi:ATP-dependent exoDNAse (exonuclease V) alpha subunit
MIVRTNEEAAALARRAQNDRLRTGHVQLPHRALADGTSVGTGDWITTRRNLRTAITLGSTDFVKNGDRWSVLAIRDDGSLVVAHLEHEARTVLPAQYVEHSVQLGYATTLHRAQGATTGQAQVLVQPSFTRAELYVALTRARAGTHIFWTDATPPIPGLTRPDHPLEGLRRILRRDGIDGGERSHRQSEPVLAATHRAAPRPSQPYAPALPVR